MRFLVLFFVVLVVVVGQVDGRRKKKIPPWHIRMAEKQGPNACVVEEVPELNKKFWTDCKYWMRRKVCGRKTIIRYECCEGYTRVHGERGCTGVKPLKNVLETADELGATIFVQYLYESGLADQILRSGTVTLFAPTNTAFESITPEQKNLLAKSYNNPRSPLLLYHLTNGRVYTTDLEAESKIDTMYPDHQVRINRYPHKMVTVNCIPIMRKDRDATNGVVHLIENLLVPQMSQNVFDAISTDGRYEELTKLLRETGLANQLQGSGSFTVFSPSDEEFTKIPRSRLDQLRRNPEAMKELISNHIIPHTVCIPAILDEHKMLTINGNKLNLTCNETGIYINKVKFIGETISGTNGISHMVGGLIVPEKIREVWTLLSDYKLDIFSQMIRKTGLESQLDNYGDITIFAFTDEAFNDMTRAQREYYEQNSQAARNLLSFHIVPGRYTKKMMINNQKLRSLDGENTLRFKVYRKGCGIESAMMTKTDIEGLNGVVHIVDKVLIPPSGNIMSTLQGDGNFSIMLDVIDRVRHLDPTILNVTQLKSGSLTLFAPSNEAFMQLGQDKLRLVMQNTTYMTKVVKNHIVDNMISTGSFRERLHYTVKTEQNPVEVNKRGISLRINTAVVTKPDIVTQEGIVHVVNKVLLPEEGHRHLYNNN